MPKAVRIDPDGTERVVDIYCADCAKHMAEVARLRDLICRVHAQVPTDVLDAKAWHAWYEIIRGRGKEKEIRGTCASCGEPVLRGDDYWSGGNGTVMHLSCRPDAAVRRITV